MLDYLKFSFKVRRVFPREHPRKSCWLTILSSSSPVQTLFMVEKKRCLGLLFILAKIPSCVNSD